MSKKIEDEKPGNLLVSVVRQVIKEEQSDSSMGVETDNKESFKDIVKAADDFASKVGSGKGVDKDKIHKGKGKGNSLKKETSQIKSKSKGNPKGNPKGKRGKSTQSNKTDGKGPKNVVSPGKTWWKNTGKGGKKNTGKVVRKEQTTTAGVAAKQRRLWPILNVMTTQEFTTTR